MTVQTAPWQPTRRAAKHVQQAPVHVHMCLLRYGQPGCRGSFDCISTWQGLQGVHGCLPLSLVLGADAIYCFYCLIWPHLPLAMLIWFVPESRTGVRLNPGSSPGLGREPNQGTSKSIASAPTPGGDGHYPFGAAPALSLFSAATNEWIRNARGWPNAQWPDVWQRRRKGGRQPWKSYLPFPTPLHRRSWQPKQCERGLWNVLDRRKENTASQGRKKVQVRKKSRPHNSFAAQYCKLYLCVSVELVGEPEGRDAHACRLLPFVFVPQHMRRSFLTATNCRLREP